jgi:CBS domain-containing protein
MRKVADIVRNQNPLTLPPTASVKDASRCMRDRRVGAVLLTEEDRRLTGIFTGRDAVHRVLAKGKSARRTQLLEVLTRNLMTIPPGKTAIDALRLMEVGGYRHLPIVDDGNVAGIFSRFDSNGIELDRLDDAGCVARRPLARSRAIGPGRTRGAAGGARSLLCRSRRDRLPPHAARIWRNRLLLSGLL